MENKWVLGHKITPQQSTGDYDLIWGETPAGVNGPPPHYHDNYHEVFLVTEGEMQFMIDGQVQVVKVGESINLAPKQLHTFSNISDRECKWVNIHSPKGFLGFFDRFGVSGDEEEAVSKSLSPEIIQQVLESAAQYDMIIAKP